MSPASLSQRGHPFGIFFQLNCVQTHPILSGVPLLGTGPNVAGVYTVNVRCLEVHARVASRCSSGEKKRSLGTKGEV